MARLDRMPEPMRSHLRKLPCPSFENHPWVAGPPLTKRQVSIISTAGIHSRGDRLFEGMTGDYRVIPGDVSARDLVMTHISTNFDRTGFQMDWNVVFPLDRLHELSEEGAIGAVADFPPDSALEFLDAFAFGDTPESPIAGVPLAVALRLAVQDLKAFYFEALTARPGDISPTSAQFKQWFWKETAAGRILKMIKQRCVNGTDKALRKTGAMLLVPLDQA